MCVYITNSWSAGGNVLICYWAVGGGCWKLKIGEKMAAEHNKKKVKKNIWVVFCKMPNKCQKVTGNVKKSKASRQNSKQKKERKDAIVNAVFGC